MYSFLLEKNERIIKKGMATLAFEDQTCMGAFYLTNERLVFIGYARTTVTSAVEVEIPLVHIDAVKAEKTFSILPNAIDITTIRGQQFRVILSGRDEWLAAIEEEIKKA